MKLDRLKITNYKNYEEATADFSSRIVTIVGDNGMGKTNIIDAIYYLCIGKSYFSSSDKLVGRLDEDFFRVEGVIEGMSIVVKVQPSRFKQIEIDGTALPKTSDHVGSYPIVVIAPGDIQALLDTSENRRNWLNSTLAQSNTIYLRHLMVYNKLLKQRNALLKSFLEGRKQDLLLLESITQQMATAGTYIYKARYKLVADIAPVFNELAGKINDNAEQFSMVYESDYLTADHATFFSKSLSRDLASGRTNSGVHKDDLVLQMNDNRLKDYGSQGQIKSYILALKLAQYQLLKQITKKNPILLLDDIFDKLDPQRMNHLLDTIVKDDFGQVFITDAHTHRVNDMLVDAKVDYQCLHIAHGKIIAQ